jgi:hypothetical protein
MAFAWSFSTSRISGTIRTYFLQILKVVEGYEEAPCAFRIPGIRNVEAEIGAIIVTI